MGQIIIKRPLEYDYDIIYFRVYVDAMPVKKNFRGKTKIIVNVPEGEHDIYFKIDKAYSNKLTFYIE
jgi:hypothetical protein